MGFETSSDVRRYLYSLLVRLERGEMDMKLATTLSNIAYKSQMSISGELKERELSRADEIANLLKQEWRRE